MRQKVESCLNGGLTNFFSVVCGALDELNDLFWGIFLFVGETS
jgi:hypothetical protein